MEKSVNNLIFDMSNDWSNKKDISTNVLIKYSKDSAGIFNDCIISNVQVDHVDNVFLGQSTSTITVTLTCPTIQYLCEEHTINETVKMLSSKVIEKEVIKEVTVIKEVEPVILTYKEIIQMYFNKYRFMI